jgi:hypothetical protein
VIGPRRGLEASYPERESYKCGYLPKDDGTEVRVERHVAALLFRAVLDFVTRIPLLGFIAWLAVRLGWPFVKHNGEMGGGKPLYGSTLLLLTGRGRMPRDFQRRNSLKMKKRGNRPMSGQARLRLFLGQDAQ